jgi:hypothetical protein
LPARSAATGRRGSSCGGAATARVHVYDAALAGGGFRTRLPLADLTDAPPSLEAAAACAAGAHEMWELSIAGMPVALPAELAGIDWAMGEHAVALERNRRGDAALVTRTIVTPIALPAPAQASASALPAPAAA